MLLCRLRVRILTFWFCSWTHLHLLWIVPWPCWFCSQKWRSNGLLAPEETRINCHEVFQLEKIRSTFQSIAVIQVAQYTLINPHFCYWVGNWKQIEAELVCISSQKNEEWWAKWEIAAFLFLLLISFAESYVQGTHPHAWNGLTASIPESDV